MIMRLLVLINLTLATSWLQAQSLESSPSLTIEAIECRGNEKTECSSITNALFLNAGDPLNEEEIETAKLRLASRPQFKSVSFHLEKGQARNQVRVIIEVEEASSIVTEWTLGARDYIYWGQHSNNQQVGGRVAETNLFGRGKILAGEFEIKNTPGATSYIYSSAKLQYFDPNFFNDKKWFLNSSIEISKRRSKNNFNDYFEITEPEFLISVGRRFGDFSYLTIFSEFSLGTRLKSNGPHRFNGVENTSGEFEETVITDPKLGFTYGWNSENDAYFPTRGSRFGFSLSRSYIASANRGYYENMTSVWTGYQNTWTSDNGNIWYFKFGQAPKSAYQKEQSETNGFSLGFARDFKGDTLFGSVDKGRWFIEPGFGGIGYSSSQGLLIPPQVKTGVRLQAKNFGVIDLFALVQGQSPKIGGAQ